MKPSVADQVAIMLNASRLAQRILHLEVEPEFGITQEAKLTAAYDVLETGMARADGADCNVARETHHVLHRAVTDIEVRILYDKLGLKTWRPA